MFAGMDRYTGVSQYCVSNSLPHEGLTCWSQVEANDTDAIHFTSAFESVAFPVSSAMVQVKR